MNTQTSFLHADFGDAELLGSGVHTLNDDVAVYGRDGAGDVEHQAGGDADLHRATDCVRVRIDCRTSRWKCIQKSDLEVVQTVHCSSANKVSLAIGLFRMADVRHLGVLKFESVDVINSFILHHHAKFREDRSP